MPPGTPSENLMCSSHILARIHMKLGTHIDLNKRILTKTIGPCATTVGPSLSLSVSLSWCMLGVCGSWGFSVRVVEEAFTFNIYLIFLLARLFYN